MREIANPDRYLERLARPLHDKARVLNYVPHGATNILDVGCSDGILTAAMASAFPAAQVLGIDLNDEFLRRAQQQVAERTNLRFEQVYLRDLLARPERFSAITFCSVLHEFWTYGEGASSVMKALADAYELLEPGGTIIIRDMILSEYTRSATLGCASIVGKVDRGPYAQAAQDFVRRFGELDTIYHVNHYLLKYWYTDNWDRELHEHYVPMTFEQYERIFELLGMSLQVKDSYLLDFLDAKWQEDFQLSADDLTLLRSTGILVARKD